MQTIPAWLDASDQLATDIVDALATLTGIQQRLRAHHEAGGGLPLTQAVTEPWHDHLDALNVMVDRLSDVADQAGHQARTARAMLRPFLDVLRDAPVGDGATMALLRPIDTPIAGPADPQNGGVAAWKPVSERPHGGGVSGWKPAGGTALRGTSPLTYPSGSCTAHLWTNTNPGESFEVAVVTGLGDDDEMPEILAAVHAKYGPDTQVVWYDGDTFYDVGEDLDGNYRGAPPMGDVEEIELSADLGMSSGEALRARLRGHPTTVPCGGPRPSAPSLHPAQPTDPTRSDTT